MKTDNLYKAIEDAVKETFASKGVQAFRNTSWFPSAGKKTGK